MPNQLHAPNGPFHRTHSKYFPLRQFFAQVLIAVVVRGQMGRASQKQYFESRAAMAFVNVSCCSCVAVNRADGVDLTTL